MSAEPLPCDANHRSGYTVDGLFVPAIAGDADLMRIVGLKPTAYCRRKKRGDYTALLQVNPDGSPAPHTQYSGFKIACWLRGESIVVAPARQFFVSARQRQLAAHRPASTGRPVPPPESLGRSSALGHSADGKQDR